MGGFSSITGDESIMNADNASFDGTERSGKMTTNGELWIGSTASPHVKKGTITSPNLTVTVGYSSPNLTLKAGGAVATTYTTDSGIATPSGNNLNIFGTSAQGLSFSGAASTITGTIVNASSSQKGVSSFGTDFTVTSGATAFATITRLKPGYTENLGISYSASTFSMTGANAALSSTNPAYVVLPSNATKGQQKLYTITAAQTFVDDSGSSTIAGNTFGTTAGVGYGSDMPFFIYAVSNASAGSPETTINFMISRIPHLTSSPVAGNIGKTGSAIADTQGSMFALENPTVADYASSPCVCIGSFRMQKTTAGTDDWTVSALSIEDGIGQFHESTIWTYPTGQFGATASKFFKANGGTAPQWTNQSGFYMIDKKGSINTIVDGATGGFAVSGVGAVNLTFSAPFNYKVNSVNQTMSIFLNSTATIRSNIYCRNPATATNDFVFVISQGAAPASIFNQDCTGSAEITAKVSYTADTA